MKASPLRFCASIAFGTKKMLWLSLALSAAGWIPAYMPAGMYAGPCVVRVTSRGRLAVIESNAVTSDVSTKYTGVVVPTAIARGTVSKASSALTVSGDAMEDLWERSRGRPLRRSLALWRFSMVATWKIIRAQLDKDDKKKLEKQTIVARWLTGELLRLGPTMIKLGQVASARTDLLPPVYIDELVALQDSVPTISADRVKSIVGAELGQPLDAVFSSFELEPIAGASLGQVHRATLGEQPVAVKVQRRNLRELFDTDFFNIRLMARVGNFFEKVTTSDGL